MGGNSGSGVSSPPCHHMQYGGGPSGAKTCLYSERSNNKMGICGFGEEKHGEGLFLFCKTQESVLIYEAKSIE